uniref:Fringe n=1 Tax=Neanthes arenaceodentata TaxID=604281 RepID=E0W703_9ANNE|nr:fringe [Neanthes arenaceodentata]
MRLPLKKCLQVTGIGLCFLVVNVFYTSLVEEIKKVSNNNKSGQNGQVWDQPKLGRALFERSRGANESLEFAENGTSKSETSSNSLRDNFSHSREVQLSDVFISVKTTKKFHTSRVNLLLETWVSIGREAVHFFTDANDSGLERKVMAGRLINTNCSARHARAALCCKMSLEFDRFLASKRKWFCHVDDDTYVNIPGLLRLLQQYNSNGDWYLGKPSLNHPLEIKDIETPNKKTAFWFATGGAGFCLSRGIALKMMPFTGGGKLKSICEKVRLPDDCSIGFIVYYYMNKELTVIPGFHSHLEGLWLIQPRDLENHITFSYARTGNTVNIVRVPGFPRDSDPTRFRSIHCHLYPNLPQCVKMKQ